MRTLRIGGTWATRALLAAAAVELFLLGQLMHPGPAPAPKPGRVVAGTMRLTYGQDWSPGAPAPGLTGWRGLTAADGGQASVGVLPADPGALRAIFGDAVPAPRRVRVGSAPALTYKARGTMAYVFTTPDGARIGLVCSDAHAPRSCDRLAEGLDVSGSIDGDPRPGVATQLRSALGAIATSWRASVVQLRSARGATRTAGAKRMATAYTALARRAQAAGLTQVAAAAGAVAGAFGSLATATAHPGPVERAAARAIPAAQARLRAAIAALRAEGYTVEGRA